MYVTFSNRIKHTISHPIPQRSAIGINWLARAIETLAILIAVGGLAALAWLALSSL